MAKAKRARSGGARSLSSRKRRTAQRPNGDAKAQPPSRSQSEAKALQRAWALKAAADARKQHTVVSPDGTLREKNSWGPAAAADLLATCELFNVPAPAAPEKFCRRMLEKWEQHGTLEDLPRCGRPPKVTKTQAEALAVCVAVREPRTQREMLQDEAFMGLIHYIEQVHGGIDLRTAWRNLLKAQPTLGKSKLIEYRPDLTDAHKRARVACVVMLLKVFCVPAGVPIEGSTAEPPTLYAGDIPPEWFGHAKADASK